MGWIDNTIAFRQGLRRLVVGWWNPEILEREAAREVLNQLIKSRWPDLEDAEVYELIYDSKTGDPAGDHYIVFIDTELGIDWQSEQELGKDANTLVAYAEAVGARRCRHLPREQVLELKRLVGQAILSGIRELKSPAQKLTKEAADFLKERTVERSRYWTLNAAHVLALIFAGILFLFSRALHFPFASLTLPVGIWIGATGGLVGAYLSVIHKAGSGEWDAASGIKIHCVEVLTKFLAGMVSGCIIFIFTRSLIAPPSFAVVAPDSYSLAILAVVSGLIERFIPKIVTKYSDKIARAD